MAWTSSVAAGTRTTPYLPDHKIHTKHKHKHTEHVPPRWQCPITPSVHISGSKPQFVPEQAQMTTQKHAVEGQQPFELSPRCAYINNTGAFSSSSSIYWFTGNKAYISHVQMMQEKEKNKPSWLQMSLTVIICSQMLRLVSCIKEASSAWQVSYNMNYQRNMKSYFNCRRFCKFLAIKLLECWDNLQL